MNGFYGAHMLARGGFPFAWIGPAVLGLAVLALIITAIVVLVRWSRRAPRTESVEILRARFARGEITKEQLEDMRRTLTT